MRRRRGGAVSSTLWRTSASATTRCGRRHSRHPKLCALWKRQLIAVQALLARSSLADCYTADIWLDGRVLEQVQGA
eukprot:5487477-Lingulodinium_polyedra.AAC.1